MAGSRQNLTIDVNINPNEQPGGAAAQIEQAPNPATNPSNLRNLATVALVAKAGWNMATSTLGQIGTITGNGQVQRRVDRASKLIGIGASFAINPLVGALSLVSSLGSDTINTRIQLRNENNSAIYYTKINGRRIDKGRIR